MYCHLVKYHVTSNGGEGEGEEGGGRERERRREGEERVNRSLTSMYK